jgi:uncharacterized protein (DUF58 family)
VQRRNPSSRALPSPPSYYQRWLTRRIPANKKQTLHRKNIFILPSKTGMGFLATLLLLWLLGTNYQNNLVLMMTFLLLSLMHTCMFYTYAALSGLSVEVLSVEPCFMGEQAQVRCRISTCSGRQHQQVSIGWGDELAAMVSIEANEIQTISLALTPTHRGYYKPERLRILSVYPLGLLKAWSSVDMDVDVLVYPKPITGELPEPRLRETSSQNKDDSTVMKKSTSQKEDISHLREYRTGDSPKHIAWKTYAKGQGLATKEYDAEQTVKREQWFAWDDFSGLPSEVRLSRLCDCVLQAEKREMTYGLQLPSMNSTEDAANSLGSGTEHQQQLLRTLALFDEHDVNKPLDRGTS